MLDRRHAGADCYLYPFGAVRVRGHFPFQLVCLIDQRLQLFVGVLSCADSIALRQHAAGSTRLDHVCAVLDLVTDSGANLLWSIRDAFFDSRIEKSGAKTILITMSATHADGVTCAHHSWSRRPAFVNGFA